MNIPGTVREGYRGLHYRAEGLKFFIKQCEIEIAINAKQGYKKGLAKWVKLRKSYCKKLSNIENDYINAYKITDYVCPKYDASVDKASADKGSVLDLEELIETAYEKVQKVAP